MNVIQHINLPKTIRYSSLPIGSLVFFHDSDTFSVTKVTKNCYIFVFRTKPTTVLSLDKDIVFLLERKDVVLYP